MSDEDVARHYASRRQGFTLISYRRVAMPMFRVTLRVLVVEEREIPPIPLFIMKSIDAGLRHVIEIAAFLGLEREIVQQATVFLLETGNVIMGAQGPDKSHLLHLTERGVLTLSRLVMQVPEEVEMTVVVDGLTRQMVTEAPLIKPKVLRANALPEIAPFPPHSKVTVEEMHPNFPDFFGKYIWSIKRKMTLIDLLGIERTERLFRDDVLALVYKSADGSQVEVGFTISGQLSHDHELMFKRSDQFSQLGLLPSDLLEAEEIFAEVLGSDILDKIPDLDKTSSLRSQLDTSREAVSRLQERLEKTDSQSEKLTVEKQLAEIQAKLQSLQEIFDAIDVRWLEVQEHATYLENALRLAQNRLMIVAPWIKKNVVDAKFIKLLRSALERGVDVYIGFGYPGDEEKDKRGSGRLPNDPEAVKALEKLAAEFSNFYFKRLGDTHAKTLACDRQYAIATSFNWLSFQGDPTRTFRDERGIYVNIPAKVDECFNNRLPSFVT